MKKSIKERDRSRRITFTLPDDVDAALRETAWEKRQSLAELIRKYCTSGLKAEVRRRKRNMVSQN